MARGKARPTPTLRLDVTLDELRVVRQRITTQHLAASDFALFDAFVVQQVWRAEGRAARMLAKVAASTAASQSTSEQAPDPSASDATTASPARDSSSSAAKTTSRDEATASPAAESEGDGNKPEPEPGDDRNPRKGHGRNSASAFRAAQHYFYALALGVIRAVCTACQLGKMYRYREKIIIRIVGQPMFRAEQHHHEQARCRNCGRVVRADGPACVHEGVGTEHIRYDWSACAMLLFMHYTGGDPFKRLESHHEGWGVPMPDANQWELVDRADDLLLPLYRAVEQHAIQRATNFRIDDTGSMVITLKRQIEAELAALRAVGKSTKGVRTGINATEIYWETLDGPIVLYYTGWHHAGEIIDQVLGRRLASRPTLVKCTDGASKNFDHAHTDKLVEATCNAHALLKFRDLKDKHPAEYAEAFHVLTLPASGGTLPPRPDRLRRTRAGVAPRGGDEGSLPPPRERGRARPPRGRRDAPRRLRRDAGGARPEAPGGSPKYDAVGREVQRGPAHTVCTTSSSVATGTICHCPSTTRATRRSG